MSESTRHGPASQVRYYDHLDDEGRAIFFGIDPDDEDYCLLVVEDETGEAVARLRMAPEGFAALRAALALAELGRVPVIS